MAENYLRIRLDEHGLLSEINQPAAKKCAQDLLNFLSQNPEEAEYEQLRLELTRVIAGEVKEPMRHTYWGWREGLWPKDILDAYGVYAFYIRGLTTGDERREQDASGTYVYVSTLADKR